MRQIIIINSFKTIMFDKTKKPIVICDIDYTFLQPEFSYKYYYDMLKHRFVNDLEREHVIKNIFDSDINIGLVRQTDKEGFLFMVEKIKQLNGKLIFLTARSSLAHIKTINDLKKAGLENPYNYQIYYTNNEIDKADFIKSNNLLDGYDQFIFIDDNHIYLQSALNIYSDMDCYLFRCIL